MRRSILGRRVGVQDLDFMRLIKTIHPKQSAMLADIVLYDTFSKILSDPALQMLAYFLDPLTSSPKIAEASNALLPSGSSLGG